MVLLHSVRSLAYMGLGEYQRRQALRASPKVIIAPMEKHFTPVYAGMRMADSFGHINNSRYLEMCEFARWHQIGYTGSGKVFRKHRIGFVVASSSIQYVREMKPNRMYTITTQFLQCESPDGIGDRSSGDVDDIRDGNPRDSRVLLMHEIWSRDRKRLHAGVMLRFAFIGPPNSPLAIPTSSGASGSRVATLSCSAVFGELIQSPPADVRRMLQEKTDAFHKRLGLQPFEGDTKGEQWADTSKRVEFEWRAKLRSLKDI